MRIIDRIPQPQVNATTTVRAPYKIYNIGNNQPVTLRRFITALETALKQKAVENHLPLQPGDVPVTYADVGFKPITEVADRLERFVLWYRNYRVKQ